MSTVRPRDDINFAETMHKFLSQRMLDLLVLIMTEENENFSARVLPVVRLIMAEGTALVLHCIADGQQGLDRLLQNRYFYCFI